MQGPILVFAECSGTEFRKSAFEAVTEGRRLADLSKTEVHALCIGHRVKDRASSLGKFGADKVYVADDESLNLFQPDFYRQIALDLTKKIHPSVILLPATSTGKDLAPRLAIHLNTVVAADCTVSGKHATVAANQLVVAAGAAGTENRDGWRAGPAPGAALRSPGPAICKSARRFCSARNRPPFECSCHQE